MPHSPEEARLYRSKLASQVVDPKGPPVDLTSLRNQNVLVTGGNSGLGAAQVVAFARLDCTVTVADIQISSVASEIAEAQSQGLKIQLVACDVTSWESQRSAFAKAAAFHLSGKLNHVVANAGVGGPVLTLPSTEDEPPPDEDPLAGITTMNISLKGCYYTTQLAAYYLHSPAHAIHPAPNHPPEPCNIPNSLILTSSMAAYSAMSLRADYCAAKFGVRGIFKSVRTQFVTKGIRVNMLSPGYILTPLLAGRVDDVIDGGYKFGKLEDVVEAVMLMTSRQDMTGRSLSVGVNGIFDFRDDLAGESGALAMWEYIESGRNNLASA